MGLNNFKDKLSGAVEGVTASLKDEKKSDELLDKAADFANEKTDHKHTDKVQKGRDFLDSKIGDENK